MPVSKKEVGECPVDAMMRVMDGRWKGTILWRLQDGPRRTSELKRSIPGITERMLIRHLHELVADGIVKRDDKKTIPPCVYYSLSSYGKTLGAATHAFTNGTKLASTTDTSMSASRLAKDSYQTDSKTRLDVNFSLDH